MKNRLIILVLGVILIGIQSGCAAKVESKPPMKMAVGSHEPGPSASPAVQEKKGDEFWTVTAVGVTEEDARKVALLKARDKVLNYLSQQQPAVNWEPTLEYLQSHQFIKGETMSLETLHDGEGHEVSAKHWCTLKVDISPSLFTDILKNEHQVVVGERQWFAGKVLAVLVAVVLAIGGYFYLDEATKGYYTLMLRLGAVSLVGAAGLVVWLIMH